MKRVIAIVITVALLASIVFVACSDTGSKVETKEDKALNETVVATIDGVEITKADYNLIYKFGYDSLLESISSYGAEMVSQMVGGDIGEYLKKSTEDQLKQLVAFSKIADEKKVSIDEAAVKKQKEQVVANYGGEEGFKSFLEEHRTTDEAVTKYLTNVEKYNKTYERLTSQGGEAYVKDEEVEPEFNENYMRVQHILISTKEETDEDGNAVPAKSDEEAQKIVKEVLAKIEAGEDFNKLIEEYDEDPGMEKDKYYTFTAGTMVAEFEEASRNLSVGEYTKEAVKTEYGYHIIKKYELDKNCDEFNQLKQSKAETKVSEILTKKMENMEVKETNKEEFGKYLDEWEKALNEKNGISTEESSAQEAPAADETPAVEATPDKKENEASEKTAQEDKQ